MPGPQTPITTTSPSAPAAPQKRSSIFTSSYNAIFTLLLLELFKEIKHADNIPRTNRILKDLVSLYIKRFLAGSKLLPISNIQQFIDFTGSIIGKMPTDTRKEFMIRQEDLIKLLQERIDFRATLIEEFNNVVKTTNESMKNIITVLAPQPNAQLGNVVVTNQIKSATTSVEAMDGKIVRENMQVVVTENKAHDHANLCARSVGVPAPRAGAEAGALPTPK